MEEKEKKLLRYIELSARETRDGCDEPCQMEMKAILAELTCSHEEALRAGRDLMERLS